FRAIAPASASVAEAVGRVNQELVRDNERAMFVTAFAARLDLATGELEYVNAGHNPTYRVAARGGVAPLPGLVDPALGAVEGHEYRAHRLRLQPRDALLLFNARGGGGGGAAGEEFPPPRLGGYLAACRDVPARQMVHGLLDRLEEFVGDAPQYDDVTILALRWLSSPG